MSGVCPANASSRSSDNRREGTPQHVATLALLRCARFTRGYFALGSIHRFVWDHVFVATGRRGGAGGPSANSLTFGSADQVGFAVPGNASGTATSPSFGNTGERQTSGKISQSAEDGCAEQFQSHSVQDRNRATASQTRSVVQIFAKRRQTRSEELLQNKKHHGLQKNNHVCAQQ